MPYDTGRCCGGGGSGGARGVKIDCGGGGICSGGGGGAGADIRVTGPLGWLVSLCTLRLRPDTDRRGGGRERISSSSSDLVWCYG